MPIARDEHDVRANDGFGNSYGHLASDHAIGARFCVMEPLLRNEVTGYIAIDFRDGTGPTGLRPNDAAVAFRDKEDIIPRKRRTKSWVSLTGEDSTTGSPGRAHSDEKRVGRRRRLGASGCQKRVVYVESATTGTFFKVYEEVRGAGSEATWSFDGGDRRAGEYENENGSENRGTGYSGGGREFAEDEQRLSERLGISVREVYLMRLNKGLEAGVLLVQGILAGLSLSTVYTALKASDVVGFVIAYELQSGEFRRAMFILCTLALMGTEDRLTQARSSQQLWARLTWFERIELQVSVLLYGICLVSTLVCAVADTTILNAQGYSSDSWYEESLYDAGFRRKILLWYVFNFTRFVLALSGWLLVCARGWRASLVSEESLIDLNGRREKLAAALEQISRLNGQNLDHLTNVELQDLGTSLKQALGCVERMIDLRYRREMP